MTELSEQTPATVDPVELKALFERIEREMKQAVAIANFSQDWHTGKAAGLFYAFRLLGPLVDPEFNQPKASLPPCGKDPQ